MTKDSISTGFEEDSSKGIIIKICFASILIIITFNILITFGFYNSSSFSFNSLSILITSCLGIIIGVAIYNLAILFEIKIGEYAGISRIISDLINVAITLVYSNYLNDLYNSFITWFLYSNLGITFKLVSLYIYYSLISPFWIQILNISMVISNFLWIFLFSYYFYLLGKERNNSFFKMTSFSYLFSFFLLLINYIIPYIFLNLLSILLQNIFLLFSFKIILTIKGNFSEKINPNYRPIHTKYE